jgi:hypothetical protein
VMVGAYFKIHDVDSTDMGVSLLVVFNAHRLVNGRNI